MLQQVNLYQTEDKVRHEPFSALLMLIVSSISIVSMMIFYALLISQNTTLNTEINALQVQYQKNLSAVEKLESLVSQLTDTNKEKAQLSFLNKRYNNKQTSLDELSSLIKGNNKGLSDYFSALARKNIDAIWFNKIDVSDGGQQLLLEGKTKDARFIPQFIAALKKETVFSGINFKLFNAQLNEEDGLVHFILQTKLENLADGL